MLFFSSVHFSEEEFEEIFKTHYKAAWYECYQYIKNKDDLCSILYDAWYAIYENFDKSKVRHSELAYIRKVVRNHALNYIKKNRTRKDDIIYLDDYPYELEDKDISVNPVESLLRNEITQEISEEIKNLPQNFVDVLSMNLEYNYTPKEIADLLQIPLKTVYGRLQRGKKLLLDRLSKNDNVNLSVRGGVDNEK